MRPNSLLAALAMGIVGLALPGLAGVAFADRVMIDDENGNTTCIDFNSRGAWWTYNDRTGDTFGSNEMDDIWVNSKGQLRFRDTNWIYHLNSGRRIQGRLSSRRSGGTIAETGTLGRGGNTWFENRKRPKQKILVVDDQVEFDEMSCYTQQPIHHGDRQSSDRPVRPDDNRQLPRPRRQ